MPAQLISIPIPPPQGLASRVGFVSDRLGIPSPRGFEFILSFILWVCLPSQLISVPPGRSIALRVPFDGLAYHRLSRCWLARRPSDHVDIPSYSLTSEIRFPIRAGWAPGGPGGVRGTGTLFLLISGGRFRCGSSCDSGFYGNDPMPSVVRILHHNRPGITCPAKLSLSIPIPSPGGFESVSSSIRWVCLPSQ